VGYFSLAFLHRSTLIFGLCVLAIGNGLFKPNISVLVGNLYALGDARRDEAFGIFYLAVNVGGILGALVGELLRSALGWPASFCAAGLALVASTWVLQFGGRHIRVEQRKALAVTSTRPTRHGVRALLLLSVVMIPFWMAYYQQGSSLTFWARDAVTRSVHLLGRRCEIPPGWFSASSAVFVLVLAAPLATLTRKLRWNSADKIATGLIFGAASFGLLWLAARQSNDARVHPIWLLSHYLLMTIGELLLVPIGLSVVSKLAPTRWVGVLFGLWFASSALANWLAGSVGHLWVAWPHEQFFGLFALVLLLTAALLATQLGWLRRTIL
jgi:POT family proton-dependent oligopeptide transporter